MAGRPGLFPPPEPDIPDLSAHYGGPAWRLVGGQRAKWTAIRVTTVDCVECAMLQHERRGGFGPRRQARHRRVHPTGDRLDLCRAHAMAWKQRDQHDSPS